PFRYFGGVASAARCDPLSHGADHVFHRVEEQADLAEWQRKGRVLAGLEQQEETHRAAVVGDDRSHPDEWGGRDFHARKTHDISPPGPSLISRSPSRRGSSGTFCAWPPPRSPLALLILATCGDSGCSLSSFWWPRWFSSRAWSGA